MLGKKITQLGAALIAIFSLQGCLVGTAIDVVGETVEAGIGITGAAAGAVVDVVTPDGKEEEDDDE